MKAARVLDDLLGVWFQTACLACGERANGSLCAGCAEPWGVEEPRCGHCGYATPAPLARCGRCTEGPLARLDGAYAPFWYFGAAHAVLAAVKFRGRFECLAMYRQAWQAAVPHTFLPPGTVLVPVPLSRRRWFTRQDNVSETLARWLVRSHRWTLRRDLLLRHRHGEAQTLRGSRAARARGVQGAFRCRGKAPPVVCLVDDVLTTGATLGACALALRRAGAERVFALTLFRTPDPR